MSRHGIIAVALAALTSIPCLAQNSYVLVAKGSEGLIRAYDAKVRDVTSTIPAKPGTSTACGAIGSGSLTAFYCPESRSIYITEKTLQSVGSSFGPEGIALIVAHEYAHARQHAIQGFTRNVVWSSVIDEVQADCVAGVYMKRATPIELSDSMIKNTTKLLENIGDYLPLEQDWHGTPEMRKQAFLHGYQEGQLSSCIASDDVNLNVNKIIKNSSEAIQNQLSQPESDLNRLLRWGSNVIKN